MLKHKIEFFNTLWEHTKNENLGYIFELLIMLLLLDTNVEAPYKLEDFTDERDLLEVTIETLAALYCRYTKEDFENVDYVKIMKEVELMDFLIKLKMEKFGTDILSELELEISQKTDNGYIVMDNNIYN